MSKTAVDVKLYEQKLKKEEQDKDLTEKKEEKNTMSLDEVKPFVQMMNKLDDLREILDNDDRLYECDFIEAISDYKGYQQNKR